MNEKCDIVHSRINKALERIPSEIVEISGREKPWITPKLKLLINKRFAAYRSRNWPIYLHLKTKIKQEIVKAKRTWLAKSASNSNGFWKSVSEIRNKRHANSLVSLLNQFSCLRVAIEEINTSLCKSYSDPRTGRK